MVAYVISLILAFILGFFLEATIGMIGFWFLEVSSLLFVYMLFNFFFSGHMFPLDMLPQPWKTIVQIIPLQYLAYFPAAVFLGKISGVDLWVGVGIQAAWTVFFIVACRAAYWRGVKRYSGFGG
jgi:ABC-2 type transport system permease protein